MKFFPKNLIVPIVLTAAFLCLGYGLERSNSYLLLLCFGLAFAAYAWIILPFFKNHFLSEKETDKWLKWGIFFRGLLLLSIPVLSDDYFRFVWDGLLLSNGFNPYLILPDRFVLLPAFEEMPVWSFLHENMNSPQYFTVYPPVAQAVFGLSAFLFPSHLLGAIVVMRLIILLAEVGTVLLIRKWLRETGRPSSWSLLYALNPLVIIELTGNLHFEAIMIFFLVMALYLLWIGKWKISAVFWALSVATKLIPLLFLPILLKKLGWKKSLFYYLLVLSCSLLLLLPFYNAQLVHNFFSSINLYFQSFEFNASIYYIIRWLGFLFKGFNIIAFAGPLLSVVAFIGIVLLQLKRKDNSLHELFTTFLLVMTTYLFLSTTVHPWYLTTLVLFAVFAKNARYIILWSGLVVLSYTAYQEEAYHENPWWVFLEYFLVFSVLIIDYFLPMKKEKMVNQGE